MLWIEEPIRADDFAGCAKVAREVATPIQIGENFMGPEQMAQAIAAGCCDYVMPDAQRIGGVTGWMRAAALAQGAGLEMSSHLFPEASVPAARGDADLPLAGVRGLGRSDARGAGADQERHGDRRRGPGPRHEVEREGREEVRRMSFFDRHFAHWPPGVPKSLSVPRTSLYYNLEVSARRYPDKAAIVYYGTHDHLRGAGARGRGAGRLPAAALRRAARRPRAALRAEQPAVHHRLLRHPARRRASWCRSTR